MPIAPIHEWFGAETLRVVTAAIGLLSVFLGYRLFCGVADRKSARPSSLFINIASGALLALFGMGILVVDVRGHSERAPVSPEWQKKSAEHGLFRPEKQHRTAGTEDRFV